MSRRALALIALLLVGAPFVAPLLSGAVCGAGYSVPNTIAAQPAGNVNASLLDANWTALRDSANTREITAGALASRPVAATCGRYYLATDTNGGTFYYDNGTTWVQLAAAVTASSGPFAVRGLVAGTASLTVINASATQVSLRSPSDGSVIIQTTTATATLSNNVIATSPAVNARDQTAQFTASSWIHVYYIWNGSTLGTLSSACAPSDVNGTCSSSFGPVLPTGYTHWAYIGAWRYNATSNLVKAHARGAWITYEAEQQIVNAATPARAVEIPVGVASLVVTNALSYQVNSYWTAANTTSGFTIKHHLRVVTGNDMHVDVGFVVSNNFVAVMSSETRIPNVGLNYWVYWDDTGGTSSGFTLNHWITGYKVPNGGE